MSGVNIIPVESKTQNPILIRMNCLALACMDGRVENKISLAKDYEDWVFSGEAPIYANVAISKSALSDLQKSGEVDETQVAIP
jgi:hypothetical protein